ncbi:MAG: hypothetical protein B6226_05510 [Candidatus Cloacimonetes bacterium 4572_65]|nr:MAG: hypothetical protein B6226_05510 [Candidatus Cloacimonetes bacterium 4572_65]
MNLAVDLHSHSGYAGGVGKISLQDISTTMKKKGIDLFGTGDALLPERYTELERVLIPVGNGLFKLAEDDSSLFMLQTEVIFTTQISGYKNRIVAHHVILFPSFKAIKEMAKLMTKWGQKNSIGRPFIVSENREVMISRFFEIQAIDESIEIIPAHIMTPDGVLGCKNMLINLEQFYGEFLPNIHAIETGLSADPVMLEKIPQISHLTFLSNSDCHSAALNRIGREFTILDVKTISYIDIIKAIRANSVVLTAEFNPAEGRYYKTGHAAKRHTTDESFLLDGELPDGVLCPICDKKMVIGVYDRIKQLQDDTIIPLKRQFIQMIPLVEVVAYSLNLKSVKSKKVVEMYESIIEIFGSEIALWLSDKSRIIELLDKSVAKKTMKAIISIKEGNFRFDPPGYDGEYGNLIIE